MARALRVPAARARRADDVSRPEGGLPKNFIRPALLLLLKEGGGHGYDLLEKLAELGLPDSDPGGLYRTLRWMEKEGLVTSWWVTSEVGPPRRSYHLTPEGEDWLHAWAGALRESRRKVSNFLRRYESARRIRPAPSSSLPPIRTIDPFP